MAGEISSLTRAGLPQIDFRPPPPSSYIMAPPDPLPPSTAAASGLAGQAGILGVAARTIAAIPMTFNDAYLAGQKQVVSNQETQGQLAGLQVKNQLLGGQPLSDDQKAALAGMTVGPDGSTSVRVPLPLEQEAALANLTHVKAETAGIASKSNLEEAQAKKALIGVKAYDAAASGFGDPADPSTADLEHILDGPPVNIGTPNSPANSPEVKANDPLSGFELPPGWKKSTDGSKIMDPAMVVYTPTAGGFTAHDPANGGKSVFHPAPRMTPLAMSYQQMTGLKPQFMESPQDFVSRAGNYIRENSMVPPGQVGQNFNQWLNKFPSTPEAKTYLAAREANDKINSAFGDGKSIDPAMAISAIDNFTKSNSGGKATIGMTELLSHAQTTGQKIQTWWNGLTGNEKQNATLPPALASEMQAVMKRGQEEAEKRLRATAPGEIARWHAQGVGPMNVQNKFNEILGEAPVIMSDPANPAPVNIPNLPAVTPVTPVAPVAPVAPVQPAATPAATVKMRAPNGDYIDVPVDKVQDALRRGAIQLR